MKCQWRGRPVLRPGVALKDLAWRRVQYLKPDDDVVIRQAYWCDDYDGVDPVWYALVRRRSDADFPIELYHSVWSPEELDHFRQAFAAAGIAYNERVEPDGEVIWS